MEGLGGGFGRPWGVRDCENKASKLKLRKIAIFKGFGESFGSGLEGVWEGFGSFWEDFERSGNTLGMVLGGILEGTLDALGALF